MSEKSWVKEKRMGRYFDVLKRDRLYNFKLAWCKGIDVLIAILTFGVIASRFEFVYRAYEMARRRGNV